MNKFVVTSLAIILIFGVAYYISDLSDPCAKTLAYSIGNVDPRFEVADDELKELLKEVEAVWETPAGSNLFEYDPDSSFKINLVFDDRQEKTMNERDMRQQIDLRADSYENVVSQYNMLNYNFNRDSGRYEALKAEYEKKLSDYNAQVAYWNTRGGAPTSDFRRLVDQKNTLQNEAAYLESMRAELNETIRLINQTADRLNELASRYNKDVDAYNGMFGSPRQFDQGNYTGESINIYQFSNDMDLSLVLAHEFGHALTLDHVENPEALMYYLMDKQDVVNLQATEADIAALKKACSL